MELAIYALVLSFSADLSRVGAERPVVLHREKRRWISATFKLVEEDMGPFPKKAMKVSNDRSQNHTVLFTMKGQGVDLEPERGLFSIDSESGQIYINHKVDREKTKELMFQVEALEKDTLQYLDEHMLYKILVIDINDNPPEFTEVKPVNVLENTAPGEEILKVEAKDPDDPRLGNGQVSYSIVSQSPAIPSNVFNINSKTGSIFLEKCLDYEAIKSYSLTIKARDSGLEVLSSSTVVEINVFDANNNLPVLTQKSASADINETDNNVVILRISVTDKDTPHTPAWRAKYTIVQGNEDENYKIETDPETNDGMLYLIKSLDYEANPQRNIKITVENEEPFATCPPLSGRGSNKLSEISAVITVKDKNDPPVFTPPVLFVRETEGQKPGKIVGRFNATDTDKFFKHSIRYVRGSDPAEWFTVDADTGVVSTVKTLDRESPYVNNSFYTLLVYAVEDGERPTTGTGTMSLFLIDINDNLPYLVNIHQEMCDDGEVPFVTVAARDDDLDPYSGPFTFMLLDNEQHIKNNWKLRRATDHSAQLVMEKKMPVGNYTVPFKIQDRQGIAQNCFLNLRICHCLDGKTCPDLKPATANLYGAAIGMFFVGLLCLLLGLCLLVFCEFSNKKAQHSLPSNEPMWTLINYNEEGGNAEMKSPIDNSNQLVSIDAGLGARRIIPVKSNMQSSAQVGYRENNGLLYGVGTWGPLNAHQGHDMNASGSQHYLETSLHAGGLSKSSYTSHSYGSKSWESGNHLGSFPFRSSMFRPINKSQEHDSNGWANRHYLEPDPTFKPHVYNSEGDDLCEPSLDAISIVEGSIGSDYLDNLDPKFTALARICQEKYPL
ncbi:cadherin-like protein 26 [Chiloscyllium plagiosum]|uniref:cadherin-like protein 26 n=1 Tax=Chiloscyllium plagiosum TaxID=36176 RepID=UPI001CB7E478|nr:cadherin-like protein 26 [Chiloscyllium plagiosum]